MDDKQDLNDIGYKMGEVDFDSQIDQMEKVHVNTDPVPAPPALPPERKVDVAVDVGKPSREKIAKEKRKLSAMAVVCALIGLFVLAVIGGSVLAVSKLSETTAAERNKIEIIDDDEPEVTPSDVDSDAEATKDEQLYIGTEELGYLKVDTYWRQISLADSAVKDRALYENGNYYITIVDEGISNVTPAMKITEWQSKVAIEGAESIEVALVEMGQFSAQQLKCYYRAQNIWTVLWVFKTEDGHLRYITVEGPNKTSRFFAVPNTYSLTK